jgi:hypothetical protein
MSDSTFTTLSFSTSVKRNTPFRIYPIGDQHCESKGHDAGRYRETLAEMKRDPAALFCFMGDEHDLASFSERRAIRNAGLHESTLHDLDQRALEKCHTFVEQHAWMSGRIMFMIQGNHYWSFTSDSAGDGVRSGMSSTQWIAAKLGTQWAGWLTYCRLFMYTGTSSSQTSIDIVASHGKAGGKLVGTAYNQVAELRGIFPAADIYLMGHDHKRGAVPDSSLYMSYANASGVGTLKQRRQWMCRTGSYLRGYVPGEEGYIVGRLLRPAELGNIKLEVTMTRIRQGNADRLTPDIRCWA